MQLWNVWLVRVPLHNVLVPSPYPMPQSLNPETFQTWSFLESLELPNKLHVNVILSTQGLVGKCFLQNRFYKLPVGQAPSFSKLGSISALGCCCGRLLCTTVQYNICTLASASVLCYCCYIYTPPPPAKLEYIFIQFSSQSIDSLLVVTELSGFLYSILPNPNLTVGLYRKMW